LLIHFTAPSSSPLPNVVPNTHPDEGSLISETEEPAPDVPPPRKLTRRVSSRQASQEPKPAVEEAPPPRRVSTCSISGDLSVHGDIDLDAPGATDRISHHNWFRRCVHCPQQPARYFCGNSTGSRS
jgi:hypothetical protein